jgi:hypothetical protein
MRAAPGEANDQRERQQEKKNPFHDGKLSSGWQGGKFAS